MGSAWEGSALAPRVLHQAAAHRFPSVRGVLEPGESSVVILVWQNVHDASPGKRPHTRARPSAGTRMSHPAVCRLLPSPTPPNRAPSRCRARARFCAVEERAARIVPNCSAAGCSALRAGNPGRARVAGPRRPLHQICGENHNSHTHARRVIKNVCELHDAPA